MTHPDPTFLPDVAVARRLRRLAALPVDLTALDAWAARHIGRRPAPAPVRHRLLWAGRTAWAAAASVAVAAVLTAVVWSTPNTALASPAAVVGLHDRTWASLDQRPPGTGALRGCHTERLDGLLITCLAVERGGFRITLMVAPADRVRSPGDAGRIVMGGLEYVVQSHGPAKMVSRVEGDTWRCAVGEATVEELVASLQGR